MTTPPNSAEFDASSSEQTQERLEAIASLQAKDYILKRKDKEIEELKSQLADKAILSAQLEQQIIFLCRENASIKMAAARKNLQ